MNTIHAKLARTAGVLFAATLWIAASVAHAAGIAITLDQPAQIAPVGGSASYTGTISNTTGHALNLDIQVEFLTSPESDLWTLDLAPQFLDLNLVLPAGGYTGPLFSAGWDPTLTGGLYGVGRLVVSSVDGADGGIATAAFSLSTPGAGPFCTSAIKFHGTANSIAIFDSLGHPIVASSNPANGSVAVGTTDGNFWKTSLVATGVGGHAAPSLAVDAFRTPHVAYYDEVAGHVIHAWNPMTGWQRETVDPAPGAGGAPSLVIDQLGQLNVSYYDGAHRSLKFATHSSGSWVSETVDSTSGVGSRSALATDEIGLPYIAYYDAANGQLRFAHRSGSGWASEVVDGVGRVGQAPSIKYRTGTFYISYGDSTPGHLALRMASGTPGAWSKQTVDSTGNPGQASTITLDGFGNPRIAYWDAASLTLRYASLTGPIWILEQVASGTAGSISLARGIHDEPVFSYQSTGAGIVRIASVGTCPASDEVAGADTPKPGSFFVLGGRPNPFRTTSVIAFAVAVRSEATVRVFDAAGRMVAEPLDRVVEPGMTQVEWNGADRDGRKLAPGTYLVQVRAGNHSQTSRLTLLR